ncbi:hypothetical protein OQJ15_12855 [Fluoribacter dumoffii]|uniref:Uncharacterized protein n=1 Tax=Fluoribacter dumoffii TaxID=463 RepID=A0A377G5Q1_9GAMM|nr:membrane protein [Fluoribacter dumoffii]KTC91683.1 hypothetical protein Ldum_2751 [Fluoribacter dumoffii NY 23]MCW8387191.1 hypothetical protein [Fluoribacter dumoffii]MCW8497395.1 hypothetical protein [Fluoribacter dumoffii]STO20152.1 Uncharacterised protein [Fluoribacter dumoffii]
MAVYKKKLKKIPRYFSLGSLTVGASLILGFLSFGGMYALYPAIYLAFAAFGLSVAYEGEIYLQNIKGAFKKLFKKDYLENHLAKEYLLEHFPADTQSKECPQFFRDYETQLKLLEEFNHKSLNKVSRKRKKQIEKTLGDMEKWFALQVFMTKESKKPSAYTAELREWLKHHEQKEWQARLENRQSTFKYVKGFSILAATFMGLGSTYLIVEAFSVIPLIAAIPFALWPIFIVPMSVVAGAAYGMLIYNTITDLINNDTINKWYTRLRNDLSQGLTARNMLMTALAVFLVSLAITLTVCTAGTWWTVATSARPLFEWMKKMPSFVMGVINPIITGLSAIFFNVENSASSFGMVYEAMTPDKDINTKRNVFQRTYREIADVLTHVWDTENWLQMLNPFRILLKLTVTPLRILLFLGHLVSVALTSDRMPGVPQIVSALVAIICEGFEDAHYFMGLNAKIKTLLEERLDSEEDHQDADIPTFLLKVLASPLYFLAAAWDCLASKMNPSTAGDSQIPQPKALTLTQAWNKQLSIPDEVEVVLSEQAKRPSKEWQKEHTLSLIEKYEKKHFDSIWFGDQIADHKKDELQKLKREIRQTDGSALGGILEAAKKNAVFNQHRLFAIREDEPTATQEFIAELPERVNAL